MMINLAVIEDINSIVTHHTKVHFILKDTAT